MSSNRGTNNGGAGGLSIPPAARKIVQSLKEIVNRPEWEIYATLKDCHMDPNEAVSSILSQGYQPAWVGARGQKSMADIVKMGRPQIKASSTPTSSHYSVEDVKASVSSETANMHQLSIQEDDHEVSSKGTTIVACIYAHGIIVACDSRGSCDIGTPEDPRVLIVDDEVTKIYRLGDHMVCTVAGNVKNCVDTIEKLFNSCNKFHERNDRQPSAHFASSSMLDIYKKDFPVKKDFKCGTIIASCDKEGPLMYYLTSDSFLRLRGLLFTQGSGGAYAYRYMQYWYHYDMDADYAAALAVASIEFAARYDSYTGGTATGIRILVWRTMLQVIQQFARMAG